MVYTKTVTAAKNGSAASPVQTHMPVTKGLLYQFELYFPPGSSGLLKARVSDGSYPLYPSEPSEWFFGDNTLISFPDKYFIQTPNQELTIWYYNEDDTYDHQFQIRIGQVLAEIFIASFLPSMAYGEIADVMTKLTEAQEEEKAARREIIEGYVGSPIPVNGEEDSD